MSFKKKVVIVTGASSGIGAAAAKMFSDEGARVVMVGRNEKKLSAVAARCASPLVVRVDIASDEGARQVIDETITKFGQIDVLVNNAAMFMDNGGLLGENMMTAYDAIMSTNIRAAVHLTHLASPHLVKTKGNVVNISSIGATVPLIDFSLLSYFISKASLNCFTVCAATELGAYGVRVNAISPGPVKTDFIENYKMDFSWDDFPPSTLLNRVSDPEEIAGLIIFLASDKAKGVTGANYVLDNGMLIKRV